VYEYEYERGWGTSIAKNRVIETVTGRDRR
jgi:hypothetical protein